MELRDPDGQAGIGHSTDTMVVDKKQKTLMVIDALVTSDTNINKKEYEKLENYLGMKEELVRIWKIKEKWSQC